MLVTVDVVVELHLLMNKDTTYSLQLSVIARGNNSYVDSQVFFMSQQCPIIFQS